MRQLKAFFERFKWTLPILGQTIVVFALLIHTPAANASRTSLDGGTQPETVVQPPAPAPAPSSTPARVNTSPVDNSSTPSSPGTPNTSNNSTAVTQSSAPTVSSPYSAGTSPSANTDAAAAPATIVGTASGNQSTNTMSSVTQTDNQNIPSPNAEGGVAAANQKNTKSTQAISWRKLSLKLGSLLAVLIMVIVLSWQIYKHKWKLALFIRRWYLRARVKLAATRSAAGMIAAKSFNRTKQLVKLPAMLWLVRTDGTDQQISGSEDLINIWHSTDPDLAAKIVQPLALISPGYESKEVFQNNLNSRGSAKPLLERKLPDFYRRNVSYTTRSLPSTSPPLNSRV